MDIRGSVALVTGANRGIGLAFARTLMDRGAAKVYACARVPETIEDENLTRLRLDVTDPAEVANAAAIATDANLVINNAGITGGEGDSLSAGGIEVARRALEVNLFGTWSVSSAFAPVLARNKGGALVNMVSVAAWGGRPRFPGYAASKAAEWSLTNSLREGLRDQGTLVVGVYAGFVEIDLAAAIDAPKISPDNVAAQTMDALRAGEAEVFADERTRQAKLSLSRPIKG